MTEQESHTASRLRELEARLEAVERRLGIAQVEVSPRPQPAAPATAPPAAPAYQPPPAQPVTLGGGAHRIVLPDFSKTLDLERLGAQAFGWIGGIAVALGVIFFVATSVQRGWISEELRIALAFIGSAALVAAGLYLFERRGQTEASLLAAAAGIVGLYASLTAGATLYDLFEPALALAVAGAIAVASTAIAIRLSSQQIAGLGILGAVLSPALVDAGTSGAALGFMVITLASAVGVAIWRRWEWLAPLTFVFSAPQLIGWLSDHYEQDLGLSLCVLVAFHALYLISALGYEIREPETSLRVSSAMLTVPNVLGTALGGWLMLDATNHGSAATTWVAGMAIVQIALGGLAAWLRGRKEIALLLVVLGVGLSAVAAALALDGPALVAAWATEAVVMAWLARRFDSNRAVAATFAFLVLAGALAVDLAVEDGFAGDVADLQTKLIGLGVIAAAALVVGRLLPGRVLEELPRFVFDEAAAIAGVLGVALVLDGPELVLALTAVGAVLAGVAAVRPNASLILGAWTYALVAIGHAVSIEAPPDPTLSAGLESVDSALLALIAPALLIAALTPVTRPLLDRVTDDRDRIATLRVLELVSALPLVYAISVAVLTLVPSSGTGAADAKQLALSVFWSVVGAALLFVGIARQATHLRLVGAAVLALTVGKVFLYDLASLDSLARVGSFVALGLLLLAAAFGYQRYVKEVEG